MVPHVVSQQPLSGEAFRAVRTLKSLTYKQIKTQTKGSNRIFIFSIMFNEMSQNLLIQMVLTLPVISACVPPEKQSLSPSMEVCRRMWSKNFVLLANIPPQVGHATSFSCV